MTRKGYFFLIIIVSSILVLAFNAFSLTPSEYGGEYGGTGKFVSFNPDVSPAEVIEVNACLTIFAENELFYGGLYIYNENVQYSCYITGVISSGNIVSINILKDNIMGDDTMVGEGGIAQGVFNDAKGNHPANMNLTVHIFQWGSGILYLELGGSECNLTQ